MILATLSGKPRPPFRYVDKGSLATIGRAAAVGEVGKLHLSGLRRLGGLVLDPRLLPDRLPQSGAASCSNGDGFTCSTTGGRGSSPARSRTSSRSRMPRAEGSRAWSTSRARAVRTRLAPHELVFTLRVRISSPPLRVPDAQAGRRRRPESGARRDRPARRPRTRCNVCETKVDRSRVGMDFARSRGHSSSNGLENGTGSGVTGPCSSRSSSNRSTRGHRLTSSIESGDRHGRSMKSRRIPGRGLRAGR